MERELVGRQDDRQEGNEAGRLPGFRYRTCANACAWVHVIDYRGSCYSASRGRRLLVGGSKHFYSFLVRTLTVAAQAARGWIQALL